MKKIRNDRTEKQFPENHWKMEAQRLQTELEQVHLRLTESLELLKNMGAHHDAENYTRSLIEASRDPLFTISSEGRITDANIAAERAMKVGREQLIGSNFYAHFTNSTLAKNVYREVFAKGFIEDYPLVIEHGTFTEVLFNGSIYKDAQGAVCGAVVVARDVTALRKIEHELIESRNFAERSANEAEIAKTNAEQASVNSENAVLAKQQFLSNMSHEIRTPMNAIIGFTKVLLKTDLNSKQREYVTAIKLSGDELIVLINDILDLAKVDSGNMIFEKTPFKLNTSLKAMMNLFALKIQEKNLEFTTSFDANLPEVLVGDPLRLHQIMINLISNAVKFTNKGSISVSVTMLSEDVDHVVVAFCVEDTGIGIPASKLDSIFENFQQASSGTSRLYGGTGLGLAIVKHLVESQAGHLNVQSELGVGSVFKFVLNFQKTSAIVEAIVPQLEPNADPKNIRVLVVEDIFLNQLLMRTLLEDCGFECEIAGNGREAIDKLEMRTFDIVLMDLQMPVMNGFQSTEYIRNTLHLSLPIIALTADVTTVDVTKCKEAGMNDYLSKPIDDRMLCHKIIQLVEEARKHESTKKHIPFQLQPEPTRTINLNALKQRVKSNPILLSEIIQAYLIQTPLLLTELNDSFAHKDWVQLASAAHKLIPSFSIMGMPAQNELIAQELQANAKNPIDIEGISLGITKLNRICTQSCIELQQELEYLNEHQNG
jgi:PAS domain S-box-containing protein